ncbi:MAG: 3-methylcrotonyl-CoA carboxylase, partial [Burkholderiaceae bacterium]|nr:3-methylcrotonyl-CoA carboxylase [Burkholderiaceae bacterium]
SLPVSVEYALGGWTVRAGDAVTCLSGLRRDGARITGLAGDARLDASVALAGETLHLFLPDAHWQLGWAPPLAHAGDDADEVGGLTAPMPGKVISLLVKAGDAVAKGQPVAVMEAMKMEHTLAAPHDGRVAELLYAVGDQVAEGAELLRLEKA